MEDIAGVRWGDVLGQNCCNIVREGGSERSGPPMNFTRGQQSTRERPEHKLPDSATIMNDMFDIFTLQTVYKFEMSKSKQNKRFCRRNADNQFLVCSGLQNIGKCIFAFYCLQPSTWVITDRFPDNDETFGVLHVFLHAPENRMLDDVLGAGSPYLCLLPYFWGRRLSPASTKAQGNSWRTRVMSSAGPTNTVSSI